MEQSVELMEIAYARNFTLESTVKYMMRNQELQNLKMVESQVVIL